MTIKKKKNHDQYYYCSNCGAGSTLLLGRCPTCLEYATFGPAISTEDAGYANQRELFISIWKERPHRCAISGELLDEFYGTDKWYACFAHILRKGHWTRYKLRAENIMLLHPDIHTLLDDCTIKDRDKYTQMTGNSFQPFYDEQERLKKQYNGSTN
jgi:hypothetical protein